MTKFGGVISKARAAKQQKEASDDQTARLQENQIYGKQDNQNTGSRPASSERYDAKAADKGGIAPETQPAELFVNMSIKVPKRLRQHWAAEAKRSGTTLTKVITDALQQRFGEP